MNGLNKVMLIGHLGSEPKASTTANGKSVTSFNIATNEFIKELNGEKITRTDWHHISTWGKTAEACAKMLRKGSKVLIEGKLRNSNNEKHSNYEIYAIDVTFLANYGHEIN